MCSKSLPDIPRVHRKLVHRVPRKAVIPGGGERACARRCTPYVDRYISVGAFARAKHGVGVGEPCAWRSRSDLNGERDQVRACVCTCSRSLGAHFCFETCYVRAEKLPARNSVTILLPFSLSLSLLVFPAFNPRLLPRCPRWRCIVDFI